MKRKYLERPFQVKSVEADGTFKGYASVFGELDSYRDIVLPGAFKKSLHRDYAEKKRSVPMLWQHNSSNPIGIYTKIDEDEVGLYVEGECNMDVQQGRECHSLMKQGALSGLSIGYNTVTSEWDEKALTRKLMELDLWEISPVTFPAGDSARVSSVKSIEGFATLSECEDALRDAGFSSKEAVTFISRVKSLGRMSDSAKDQDDAVTAALKIIQSL